MSNISSSTERYDEFILIDGVDVDFEYNGSYLYNIYQQTSAINTDVNNTDGIVETGRAEVIEASAANIFYESPIEFNIYG